LSGLVLNPLSRETEFIEDPLGGQIPFRPREVTPESEFRWLDTGLTGDMAWLQPPMPEERRQRLAGKSSATSPFPAKVHGCWGGGGRLLPLPTATGASLNRRLVID
jgi:hypothetical protein